MGRIEHYKKEIERENLKKLLSLLKKHGNMRFQDLKKKLEVSSPTLSSYIRKLGDKIEDFRFEGEDRRTKRYRIKPENSQKVEAELLKYEAIKFIRGISNPIYSYVQDKSGQRAIATFISGIDQRIDVLAQKVADRMVKQYLKLVRVPLLPNQGIATVIMVKGREGSKP